MKPRSLLLMLTMGLWLAVETIGWPGRPGRPQSSDIIEFCCELALWFAPAQLAATLLPLGSNRLLFPGLIAISLGVFNLAVWRFHFPHELTIGGVYKLALHQVAVLFPLAVLSRFLGLRLQHVMQMPSHATVTSRQFSLLAMLLWTAAAAVYCLLLTKVAFAQFKGWFSIVFLISLPAVLTTIVLSTLFTERRILWKTALLVAVIILTANSASALGGQGFFSAWKMAAFYTSPVLLVWLTCLTLRAFGWRLVWQKSQPLRPAADGAAAENA